MFYLLIFLFISNHKKYFSFILLNMIKENKKELKEENHKLIKHFFENYENLLKKFQR